MPTTITGTDGVSQVQTGAVESGDLPAGSVIQVVSETYGTSVNTTSTSFIDFGLQASITPTASSSKIMVFVSFGSPYVVDAAERGAIDTALVRNSTPIITSAGVWNGDNTADLGVGSITIFTLDTPSTTSTLTYSTQFRSINGGRVFLNATLNGEGVVSNITLMEIAG